MYHNSEARIKMSSLRRRNALPGAKCRPYRVQIFTSDRRNWKTSEHKKPMDGLASAIAHYEKDEHGLTTKQVDAFQEVFNLFDINGGGTIDADELDAALKTVDINLTHKEIQDVLHVIDEDGNGEIDFEEFLTLMTSTERYLEGLRGGPKDEQKEHVLFSALTKFMKKSALSSLSEIERYYNNKVRKSPHVVGHYAAGARLIGLTEKQMAKHLATLSASGGDNQDSPYAQPLCLFASNFPTKVVSKRRTGHGRIKLTVVKGGPEQKDHSTPTTTTTTTTTEHTTTEHTTEKHTTPMITQPAPPTTTKKPSVERTLTPPATKGNKVSRRVVRSLQGLQPIYFPLPKVCVKQKDPNRLTVEDLPAIREKVQAAYQTHRMKITNAQDEIMKNSTLTDLSTIPTRAMKLKHKLILEAYGYQPTSVPSLPPIKAATV